MMQAAPVRKRRRSSDADGHGKEIEPADKKARPTLTSLSSESLWQPQHIFSSPSRSYHSQQDKYDSDDHSSMLSEPGSPQVISADEADPDAMSEDEDLASFSQQRAGSPDYEPGSLQTPWKARTQAGHRIPTPIIPRPKTSPIQTHIRRRHPQENIGSDRLDVPSPIDEDEVPTPPSAAEAAGSQLELLSVSDVEMQGADPLPQIAVSPSQPPPNTSQAPQYSDGPGSMMVRKQRQRSGALSAGYGSPMRDPSAMATDSGEASTAGVNKRGISMGYRPDCEKCRLGVPGHLNHFF